MSFLATEGADDSTLCELLEIVDAWAPGASAAGCQGPAEPSLSGVPSGSDDGCHAVKTRKRMRNPEVDVRRRLKKKKERETLFALVHELQGRHEQLRWSRRCQCRSPTTVTARTFCRHCVTVDEELTTALGANQQLKAEVARNAVLIRVLHDAVSVPKVEMELTADIVATAMETHRSALQDMYAELGAVFKPFPPLSANAPFFYRSDTKFDATGTPRVELSTALYLPWDLRRASSAFAKGIIQLSPFGNAVSHCLETQADSAEQGYSLDGRAPNTSPGLQSVGLVQKRQNDDSMVLMWSSQIFHPTAGMAFIGRARIRVTGLSSELSLIEAFTDVSATELQRSSLAPSIDPDAAMSVRSALVGAFGSRVGYKHKAFLKRMLVSSGRSHLAAVIML